MCTLFLAIKAHPKIPFFVCENRDEFFSRPFTPLHQWKKPPNLWAGRDEPSAGTWMGVTAQGRFAAITNFRDPAHKKSGAPSRGLIVLDFLASSESPEVFAKGLISKLGDYNGFNLLFGNAEDEIFYLSSRHSRLQKLEPGIYGLSNADLGTPWPKVSRGLTEVRRWFEIPNLNSEDLVQKSFHLLSDRSLADPKDLPSTGVPPEIEHKLSAIFIEIPGSYGTVASSVIVLNGQRTLAFHEKCFGPQHSGSKKEIKLKLP